MEAAMDSVAEAMDLAVAADLAAQAMGRTAVVAVLAVQAAGSMGQAVATTEQAVDRTAEAVAIATMADAAETMADAAETMADTAETMADTAESMADTAETTADIMVTTTDIMDTTESITDTIGMMGIHTTGVVGGFRGFLVLVGVIHGIGTTGIPTTAPIMMAMAIRMGVTTEAIMAARTMETIMPTVRE